MDIVKRQTIGIVYEKKGFVISTSVNKSDEEIGNSSLWRYLRGVMVKSQDCRIVVSEFEPQWR